MIEFAEKFLNFVDVVVAPQGRVKPERFRRCRRTFPPTVGSEAGGQGSADDAASEQAAAQEAAFREPGSRERLRREPGHLAHRGPAIAANVRSQHPSVKVGLQSAESLRVSVKPDRDQRSAEPAARSQVFGSSSSWGRTTRSSRSPRNRRAAAVATTCGSLSQPATHLQVAGLDHLPKRVAVDEVLPDQLIHLGGQLQNRFGRDEIDAALLEVAYLRRRTGPHSAGQ